MSDNAPTWADLPQGCYPTMTGGMSPEDYIAYGRGDRSVADPRAAALRAARSASEQSRDTAVRAEVVMLRQELADMRRKFEHLQQDLDLANDTLSHARLSLSASQALADRAITERDQWHRLAVESDRRVNQLEPVVNAAVNYHSQEIEGNVAVPMQPRRIIRDRFDATIRNYREQAGLSGCVQGERTHDGIVLDKAIRPRGVTG